MRPRLAICVSSSLLVAVAWPALTTHARASSSVGKFAVLCDLVTTKFIDPITGSAATHKHEFFGSKSVRLNETVSDLRSAGTTCKDTRDTASYWAPTLYVNGVSITSTSLGAYYNNGRKSASRLHNLPPGLKLIAGNSHATSRQSLKIAWFNCGEGTTAANDKHRNYIPACPHGAQALKLHVVYPDCLAVDKDGNPLLDSADHQSHAAYSSGGRCPSGHPYGIPQIIQSWRYRAIAFPHTQFPNPKDVGGHDDVYLSSDRDGAAPPSSQEGITAHADFFNGWNYSNKGSQRGLDDLFQHCIVAMKNCGTFK